MSDKKNLLSESTIRRFMKLATLEPLAEIFVENNPVENETDELEESEETEELEEADVDEARKFTAAQRRERRGKEPAGDVGAIRRAKEEQAKQALEKEKRLAGMNEDFGDLPGEEEEEDIPMGPGLEVEPEETELSAETPATPETIGDVINMLVDEVFNKIEGVNISTTVEEPGVEAEVGPEVAPEVGPGVEAEVPEEEEAPGLGGLYAENKEKLAEIIANRIFEKIRSKSTK